MTKYYVYVLRSIDFNRNYTGFTSDIEKRLAEHNLGKTKSTKPYRPWEILFYEEYDNKADALKREKYLKSGVGREYVKNKYLAS